MKYSLTHLADQVLLSSLATLVSRDRANTAVLLAHIAEVDERRLYLPAAYPSMFAYCVGELHLSEEAAGKRIHAARAAREFPALFEAIADGRLHLSAVTMLAPKLTSENADELIRAATHKTKAQIEQLIADRFPRADVPTMLRAVPVREHAPGRVDDDSPQGHSLPITAPVASEHPVAAMEHAPGHVASPGRAPKIAPLAPERFALQVTIPKSARDKLRYAQELLSHSVRSGDVAQVLEHALDALIAKLEKSKFAATSKPRPRKGSTDPRHVPSSIKRDVWKRDHGRCTYVSDAGRRCESRAFLEYDHVDEVALGGLPTLGGIRLRCRAHNQFTAEQTFGREFMSRKRQGEA